MSVQSETPVITEERIAANGMKLERTKNAARNIVFDGTMEMVNMLFPFVIRSVMLHFLGTEYLGLNGLFKSLLTFLNLAELGVGSAMVFSMYKPIAEDDAPSICALLRLYRTLYRIIGLVILAAGLIALGTRSGEVQTVFVKATRICMECIGLG